MLFVAEGATRSKRFPWKGEMFLINNGMMTDSEVRMADFIYKNIAHKVKSCL